MSRRHLSGFCNPANPQDSHQRCDDHPRADGVPCDCPCHWTATAGDPLTAVCEAVQALEDQQDRLVEACTDPEARDLAEFLLTVREAREQLQGIERDLEAATAKAMLGDYADSPTLRVERSRATDRKAWDHESWQRDVRTKVLRAAGLAGVQGVLDANGEVLDPRVLHEALAQLQAAHGSAAPKTTALRQLGLDARDYCESTPGAWRVKVLRMAAEGGGTDAA